MRRVRVRLVRRMRIMVKRDEKRCLSQRRRVGAGESKGGWGG